MLKEKASGYSREFQNTEWLVDVGHRRRKAEKIGAVLAQEGWTPQAGMRVLDVGCAHGLILHRLVTEGETGQGGTGVGIELDRFALGALVGEGAPTNLVFAQADGEALPFAPHSFDVVVCNHVYEHTDNAAQLMAEIARVLKPSGLCYLAGPNRFALIEPHYHLPLLSWLPQGLADAWVRWCGLGDGYAICPYSRPALKRLLRHFDCCEYTGRIVADPQRYWVEDILPPASWKQRIARAVWWLAPGLFPDFVWVLHSKGRTDGD